jgi:hypothetical protein
VVRQNLPGVTTFDEFFRLDEGERGRRVAALRAIPPELGNRIPEDGSNYEAQQPPLAYALLAPFDRLWSGLPLPERIWRLRLICAMAGVLGTAWGALALGARLGLAPPAARAAAFLALSSQMLYGAAAHVANDWLAVALAPFLLLAAVAYRQSASRPGAFWMGAAMAAGLLSKVYYLALLPLPLALVLRRRRDWWPFAAGLLAAAPWYARNWVLYGNITGLMDAVTNRGVGEIVGAAARMPWGTVAAASARRALWTANNSFDSFSAATLNVLLALAAAAAVCGALTWKQGARRGEGVLVAACGLFAALLAYSTAFLYLVFGTAAYGGAPWYTPAMFGAGFVLAATWTGRAAQPGRAILAAMLAGWGYVMAATWWVKLIPLYGGFQGRAQPGALAGWYAHGGTAGVTAMVRAEGILWMAAGSAIMALGLAAVLGTQLLKERGEAVDGSRQ